MQKSLLVDVSIAKVIIGVIGVLGLGASQRSAAATYEITLLEGAPGATYTHVTAVNNAGKAVGNSDGTVTLEGVTTGGGRFALQWIDRIPSIVAFDYGVNVVGGSDPYISAINSKGAMVGLLFGKFAIPEYWNESFQSFDLAYNFIYNSSNAASGINDAGQIVGNLQPGYYGASQFATLWEQYNAPATTLDELPGTSSSVALSINESGAAVGNTIFANGNLAATIWKSPDHAKALASLGGTNSAATAINAGGRVVGWANTKAGDQHAVLWHRGIIEDLGTLGGKTSSALAIDSEGNIVGTAQHKGCCAAHAVLWPNATDEPIDLNAEISEGESKEHTLVAAVGINDKGEIAVNGYNNKTYADESYLLRRTKKDSCPTF